jgi:hypothetical protein
MLTESLMETIPPRQVKERQLCVFFRNNHFSTLYKVRRWIYPWTCRALW